MFLKKVLSVYSLGLRRTFSTTNTAWSSVETYKITASSTPAGDATYISGKTHQEKKVGKALEEILAALSGCGNTTACYYAKTLGIEIRNISFKVEADYDTGRFLSVGQEPNIFSQIRMDVEVDLDGTQEDVEQLRDSVAKHSPVHNMLSLAGVDIQSNWTQKKKD